MSKTYLGRMQTAWGAARCTIAGSERALLTFTANFDMHFQFRCKIVSLCKYHQYRAIDMLTELATKVTCAGADPQLQLSGSCQPFF
jgi:hypothetical protein